MFGYFENQKTTYFDVFCLNFSIEMKIKNFISNFIFQFIKKTEMALWVNGFTLVPCFVPGFNLLSCE